MTQKIIFITGCSSGIGGALAQEFKRRGHLVYATARRAESLAALTGAGMAALTLDVNDDDSIATALAAVQREQGRIDLLINNAGYGQFGAVLDLGRDDLRRQFETNVIAPVALVRAALPLLRASGNPRIANIGSIVGIASTPFAGAYCASKAALHSLSDAMRMELAPFGIQVITVQPGGIESGFGEAGTAAVRLPADSIYAPVAKKIQARARASQHGATPVARFASAVATALLAARPVPVLRLGAHSTKLFLFKRLLPTRMYDRILSRRFGLNKLARPA